MPRFFFDVQDDVSTRDPDGTDLKDVWAARVQAAALVGRILADAAERFWEDGELSVTVRDDDDLVLFTVSTLAFDAPAAPKVPARQGGRLDT